MDSAVVFLNSNQNVLPQADSACINGPQYIQQMLRNEKEIMGRKATLKGESGKRNRDSPIPSRAQSPC